MGRNSFFRGNHNNFYYTNDNWKTYEKSVDMRTGYTLENSENVKKTIDIREKFDKSRSDILIKELKKIRKLLIKKGIIDKKLDDGYGSAFEVFAINVLHNFEYSKIIDDFLVVGGDDGKVDSVVYDNEECSVYQIKIGHIDPHTIPKARNNIREFISTKTMTANNTKDLLSFCRQHNNYFNAEPKYFDVSSDGTGNNHIDSFSLFTRFFENNIISQDFKANKYVLRIELEKRISVQDGSTEEKNYSWLGDKAYFTFVKAKSLVQEVKRITEGKDSAIDKLFGFNVRGYKGTNKNMKQTIQSEPNNFCLYNNGISIVGKCTIGDFLTISEPYVVNGQQTLLNLMASENKLDDVYVPLFAKNYENNVVLMNIAKYNNKQSPIKSKDLLSIDSGVREIQKSLFESTGYYLNILSSGKKTYMSMVKKIFAPTKIIELSDFLRCYSVITKKDNLATWKNNVSSLLEKEYVGNNIQFAIDEAKKACEIIEIEKQIIENDKSKYAIANVAIEYVLSQTNNNVEKTKDVIDTYLKVRFDDVEISKRKNNKAELFRGKNDALKQDLDKLISGEELTPMI